MKAQITKHLVEKHGGRLHFSECGHWFTNKQWAVRYPHAQLDLGDMPRLYKKEKPEVEAALDVVRGDAYSLVSPLPTLWADSLALYGRGEILAWIDADFYATFGAESEVFAAGPRLPVLFCDIGSGPHDRADILAISMGMTDPLSRMGAKEREAVVKYLSDRGVVSVSRHVIEVNR